jgi:hypothetical protein
LFDPIYKREVGLVEKLVVNLNFLAQFEPFGRSDGKFSERDKFFWSGILSLKYKELRLQVMGMLISLASSRELEMSLNALVSMMQQRFESSADL